jgi:hypothetical protein
MKIFLAALIAITLGGAAWAACPKGTAYQCTQGANGKVICGCY